ncbi:hypothetical protein WME79_11680 [Sorangium sp. So ce726]|uniref:hypothetical protein n=1 Tax=Sorangium sp. So ce726 TaxID=3133319 RepID=UPI003F642A9C
MNTRHLASRILAHEARALLTRIAGVRSFALHETMVRAAAISSPAQAAIEAHMVDGKRRLDADVRGYLRWLAEPEGRAATPADMQRRFTFLRLRFNAVLSQFDIFAQATSQRSEHEVGVWLAGLDEVCWDALALRGEYYATPPVICYLDRGMGAAIRRARTRLPGGDLSPVAIIRVPRERMVGTGIASSLIHEVGHQGAALLGLLPALRTALDAERGKHTGAAAEAWSNWYRWISEIVADLWSVATIGVAATMGLVAVVSLPQAFVFRENADDPHPTPWIRVKLSVAMGKALFPHPQWDRLARVWEELYPTGGLPVAVRGRLAAIEATMPAFVALLLSHRPRALRGKMLAEAFPVALRQPGKLAALYQTWKASPALVHRATPTLVFAVFGQARADGVMNPEEDSRAIGGLLTSWALKSALETSASCAALPRVRSAAA